MREEVLRRVVHATGTLVPVLYLLVPALTWVHVQAFLLVALSVATVLESVRLFVGLDWRVYRRLTREYEQDNPAGYALYFVGMTAVALAFPPTAADALVAYPPLAVPGVAVSAMLMLSVADPVSGLLSSGEVGSIKESYVLLATFGVATLLASPFVPGLAAVLGGVAATVADGVKPVVRGYVVDDNLSIPVSAAVVMYLAVAVLPPLPAVLPVPA